MVARNLLASLQAWNAMAAFRTLASLCSPMSVLPTYLHALQRCRTQNLLYIWMNAAVIDLRSTPQCRQIIRWHFGHTVDYTCDHFDHFLTTLITSLITLSPSLVLNLSLLASIWNVLCFSIFCLRGPNWFYVSCVHRPYLFSHKGKAYAVWWLNTSCYYYYYLFLTLFPPFKLFSY